MTRETEITRHTKGDRAIHRLKSYRIERRFNGPYPSEYRKCMTKIVRRTTGVKDSYL